MAPSAPWASGGAGCGWRADGKAVLARARSRARVRGIGLMAERETANSSPLY
jgi:hypothetical protein